MRNATLATCWKNRFKFLYIHIYILFQLKLFHLISGNKKTFLVLILVNYNNPAENAIAEINYSLMLL